MDIKSEKLSKPLKGKIEIPSDKSISHRTAMLALLTGEKNCEITNFSKGADCHSTLRVIKQLGCNITFENEQHIIINAPKELKTPKTPLDCGNSGTTMRLMAGILAGQNFNSTLTGDESLSKRPMKRIIAPLEKMGAQIRTTDFTAPLNILGKNLHGIDYVSDLASAQVKSSVLLAGLFAEGETKYTEKSLSRNHTELMLKYLSADININGTTTLIKPSKLSFRKINVCGDISSAAFFMVAAAIVPDSEIILTNVGINETRSGIVDVLNEMGAQIELLNINNEQNEPIADIKITYSTLKAITIEGELIPRLIDELPVIALLATQAQGTTIIKNAADLRNKETDRIMAITKELKKLGANIEETPEGFIIEGKTPLQGGVTTCCYHDHRIAMTLYVAGLISHKPVIIEEFDWVNISFPEFLQLMTYLKN